MASLEVVVRLAGVSANVHAAQGTAQPSEVVIQLPVAEVPGTGCLWLQCDPETLTPIRMLALPIVPGSFAFDALHALVGLAATGEDFVSATLDRVKGTPAAQWLRERSRPDAWPLSSTLSDTVWGLGERDDQPASAWFVPDHPTPIRTSPDELWWAAFDEFVAAPGSSMPELRDHLGQVFEIPWGWELVELKAAPTPLDAITPEAGVVARIVPSEDRVVLALDFDQPVKVISDALLHLCGHCELGHVRPGDQWGHWDTVESVSTIAPHRQWDRDVGKLLKAVCSRPSIRQASSLQDCTPVEKAWLVLQGHIGKMVGETRTLHPSAERYQAAAYQRQAAQRIVGQLEDYAGAMLCDGVGLGKTYVATTVMVHYANSWRDRMSEMAQSAADDPFRITAARPRQRARGLGSGRAGR